MSYVYEPNLKRRSGATDSDADETQLLYKWNPSTGTVLHGSYDNLVTVDNKQFVGWDVPDYYKRLKRGELIPHTPWMRIQYSGYTSGTYNVWTSGNTSHWWAVNQWTYLDSWCISEEDVYAYAPDAYDMYVNEAAAKIYSSGYDALTAIAELTQIRSLFKQTITRLLSLKLPKNWKELSCDWLSYRYGWRTLFYDIKNINEAISNFDEKRTRYSEKCGNQQTQTSTSATTVEKAHYYLDQTIIDKVTISLRGSVTADIVVPKFQFNPLQTAWELVPLSFVVDWLLTVGKSLAAMSFLTFQTNYSASKGYRIEFIRSFNSGIGETKDTFDSGTDDQYGSSKVELEVRNPCRVPLTPHFTMRLDSFKILDLLALVTQRI